MLEARGIYKYYVDNNKHKKLILKDCNIKIEKNVSIGLMGESGCGKSSLAKILLRLLSIDKGKILFCEKNITKLMVIN